MYVTRWSNYKKDQRKGWEMYEQIGHLVLNKISDLRRHHKVKAVLSIVTQ